MKQQRNAQGRFLIGNPGGPGRPKRQTEAGYLEILMEACDLDTWRNVVDRAVEDAQAGDDRARGWLSSYLIGKPESVAPAPTAVVINQLLNIDAALETAAERLALPIINRETCPALQEGDDWKESVRREAAEAILTAVTKPGTKPPKETAS